VPPRSQTFLTKVGLLFQEIRQGDPGGTHDLSLPLCLIQTDQIEYNVTGVVRMARHDKLLCQYAAESKYWLCFAVIVQDVFDIALRASSRTASACMRYYPNSTVMKARCGDFNGRKEVLELVIFHGSPSSDYPLYSAISSFRSQ